MSKLSSIKIKWYNSRFQALAIFSSFCCVFKYASVSMLAHYSTYSNFSLIKKVNCTSYSTIIIKGTLIYRYTTNFPNKVLTCTHWADCFEGVWSWVARQVQRNLTKYLFRRRNVIEQQLSCYNLLCWKSKLLICSGALLGTGQFCCWVEGWALSTSGTWSKSPSRNTSGLIKVSQGITSS